MGSRERNRLACYARSLPSVSERIQAQLRLAFHHVIKLSRSASVRSNLMAKGQGLEMV